MADGTITQVGGATISSMHQIEGDGVSNLSNIETVFQQFKILVEHNTKWLDSSMLTAWIGKMDSDSTLLTAITIVNTLRLANRFVLVF